MKSSATPAEDKIFINSIEKLYNSQMGAGSYKEAFDYASSRSADTAMTPMDFAVRVSGGLYKKSMQDGSEEVTMRS